MVPRIRHVHDTKHYHPQPLKQIRFPIKVPRQFNEQRLVCAKNGPVKKNEIEHLHRIIKSKWISELNIKPKS